MYIDLKPLIQSIENSIEVGQAAPILAILKYGDRADSKAYIRSIEKKAAQLGIKVIVQNLYGVFSVNLGAKVIELALLADAILPIRPLPEYVEENIKSRLVRTKDIDNFSQESIFENCTGEATLEILKFLGIGIEKKVCIVGMGVGFEIHKTLLKADYSPTPIHSKTPLDLVAERIKEADVVVSATGVKGLIKKDMVKPGALVIDIGLGDIAKGVEEIADVTTIRDGVGAVTTVILFKHIFQTVN